MATKSISILILAILIAKNCVLSAPVTDSESKTTIETENTIETESTIETENTIETESTIETDTDTVTYPLTKPIVEDDGTIRYRIGIICDLDKESKSTDEKNTWISYFKKGYLNYNPATQVVEIVWDEGDDIVLKSHNAANGRGMELSELVTYDGKLLTVDDKTGIVYAIGDDDSLTEWVVLKENDENGISDKGFKGEWATVQGGNLYVGSHGTEHKIDENNVSYVNMWVKEINKNGDIKHVNWEHNYKALRAAIKIDYPGYVIHEACEWSDEHGKYFFLPRKSSTEPFDPKIDVSKATNVLMSASPNFKDITVKTVGDVAPFHGYASFKFIPNTKDSIIVAIKSKEHDDVQATFITVFDIEGNIIVHETFVSDYKFEGFDFI